MENFGIWLSLREKVAHRNAQARLGRICVMFITLLPRLSHFRQRSSILFILYLPTFVFLNFTEGPSQQTNLFFYLFEDKFRAFHNVNINVRPTDIRNVKLAFLALNKNKLDATGSVTLRFTS